MGGSVWKIITVLCPRAVNGLNVAGYGRSEPEKSWTVSSLVSGTKDDDIGYSSIVLVTRASIYRGRP